MEEELKTNTPEIVEDMPDFEENTTDFPCEDEESPTECTATAENENVSEEISEESADTETEQETADSDTDTETKNGADPADSAETDKAEDKDEKKEEKSNLPAGCSFNPLVFALKPFYKELMAEDELFANEVKEKESRSEKPKSLAECAEYILGEAYHYAYEHRDGSYGMSVMPDDDMKNLIKHYYDEDDIVIRKMGAGTRVATATAKTPTAPVPVKTAKKGKDKPKPVKNVVNIADAIVSATKAKENGKDTKKDNLKAGFVPMERPDTEKDAKKGSREQAKSIVQMDMFADFFSE